jgi:tetratricopeptide (TPR) repeat protein
MWIRVLVAIALAGSVARADEWKSPSPVTIASPSGRLKATITPASLDASGAHATIGGGPVFSLATPWMPVDAILFDDGTLLTLDSWHRLGYGDVATLYEHDGKVRWSKSLVQMLGQAFVDAAPHSVSSIWWRKTPVEWSLAADGKSGSITLYDEHRMELVLRDGSAKLVAVDKLPDDPRRLVNRARALAETGQNAQAIVLLERAIAKDPDMLEAVLLYAETLQHMNDHARVAADLERMSARWTTKTGYDVANIDVVWAKSLAVLSRTVDAERVLRRAVVAAPTYTNPAIALAKLLADHNRSSDADAVLTDFVAHLGATPSLDTYALADIAAFYTSRSELAKALALYLKGYKPTEVTNQFLYMELANLYEQMGNDAEAIRVDQQLLAYFVKMGSAFASYEASTRAELTRLRAKPRP